MKFQIGRRQGQRIRLFNIGIDQNQHGIFSFRGFAKQRINRRVGRAESREFCAVEKARVAGEQAVKLREFGNDVVRVVPREAGTAVDFDFFGGEPFDTPGETKTAARTGQRAKTVAQQRPHAPAGGKAVVVVGFAVMNVGANARTLAIGVVEVIGDLATGVILEKFGVSPLHSAVGEQIFGGFPRAAEAFEQEDGFGKFVLHPGDDVLPGGHGNFVAGVTTKTIHAAPAPD